MSALVVRGGEAAVVAVLAAGAMALAGRDPDRVAAAPAARPARPVTVTQVLLAVGAGALAWAATGWPAAGAWGAVGGWAAPVLARRDRMRAKDTARLDAWATWVGLIGGQLAGQASLAEALLAACRRAPAVLAEDLAPLADALAVVPLDEALSGWGAERAESAELRQVALVLGLAASGAGGHVTQVLAQLGAQLRARAGSARRIERERRRTRLAGRAAAGVAAAWMLAGARLDSSLFGVYSHPAGQLLLAGLLGVVAAGLWGLARLDRSLA